ncbi:nudix hydrolase 2-like [Curcuma longa]|uniref:nudix hydrolase 2-like n=1 Tax=Curcuma longa TaxID=136217 RepID=UPI003D9F3456
MSISTSSSSVLAPKLLFDNDEDVALLTAVNDEHGGVIVEIKDPMDPTDFSTSLRSSLINWRKQGKKGVWIKLPINLANLVEAVVQEGFLYHHAEPTYLMLVRWLPNTQHTIPANASHRVGIGAFVMNDNREILVVQEKNGILKGSGFWKFPTGVVEQGEDIHVGAIREVKEETGIDTEFVEVLAFRQTHKAFFEKSDFFFLCLLRPLSFDIHIQELEIEAAKWMPIQEYADQPFVQKHELLKYILEVSLAKIDKGYSGFSPVQIRSTFFGAQTEDCLFLNSKDFNH